MNKSIHFFVSGRVQGVFFRMRTKHRADGLGLTGWVRNLPDGRVEGIASGAESKLSEFTRWLHEGPEYARVDDVAIQELESQDFPGFRVR